MRNLRKPLSERELDILDDYLLRVEGGLVPNVEAFDGFITALAVCPELVQPSEFIDAIQCGETEDGDLVFENGQEAEEFIGLIMRHWNAVNADLDRETLHMPILMEDEDGKTSANDWAIGFVQGTRLRPAIWQELMDDEDHGGGIVPIFALAFEHDEDPELRPYPDAISDDLREELIVGMIAGVGSLYKAAKPMRMTGTDERPLHEAQSWRRKVGRNEPCPCGSGRKYKKCCGAAMIH